MLAGDLKPRLEAAGYEALSPKKAQLDITQAGHVSAILATLKPQAVFNCAAFTKVDLCETDPLAEAVNDGAVGNLAEACGRSGARLVHVSTDFVFGGTSASRTARGTKRRRSLPTAGRNAAESSGPCRCRALSSCAALGCSEAEARTSSRRS